MITFYKYHGTGNDFIIADNRTEDFPKDMDTLKKMCDRRFGIGADGLILLENDPDADFRMVYYNSDGNESSMCGNGGRCIVAFAHFLDLFEEKTTFNAIDGLHEAEMKNGIVRLKMIDVEDIEANDSHFVLNTGSPHLVKFENDVKNFPVYEEGFRIRNSDKFMKEGINVNFVEVTGEDEIFVRTYERGVENETYSCGTGATASALVFMKDRDISEVSVKVLGGNLKVYAEKDKSSFHNIWLEGPAAQVFTGKIQL